MSRLFDDDDDNFLTSNLSASDDNFRGKKEKKRSSLSSVSSVSSRNKRSSINPKPRASQSLESSVFEPIQDLPQLDLFNYLNYPLSSSSSERMESFFAMYQFLAAQPDLCNMTSFVNTTNTPKFLTKPST